MSTQPSIVEIDCLEVRRQLVNYTEGDLAPELLAQIEQHLGNCRHCSVVYDGVNNVVQLVGDERTIKLPPGFSRRLYKRLLETTSH